MGICQFKVEDGAQGFDGLVLLDHFHELLAARQDLHLLVLLVDADVQYDGAVVQIHLQRVHDAALNIAHLLLVEQERFAYQVGGELRGLPQHLFSVGLSGHQASHLKRHTEQTVDYGDVELVEIQVDL